jgi:hypothetical protein
MNASESLMRRRKYVATVKTIQPSLWVGPSIAEDLLTGYAAVGVEET